MAVVVSAMAAAVAPMLPVSAPVSAMMIAVAMTNETPDTDTLELTFKDGTRVTLTREG